MPPRQHSHTKYLTHFFWLAISCYLSHCFHLRSVNAQQQHHFPVKCKLTDSLRITGKAHHDEVLSSHGHSKKSPRFEKNENDASAIATLAPARSAVVAPSLRLSSGIDAENLSLQIARNLGDWEVEDFVLLATVDGTLYACDRSTGEQRWHISYEQPMVQINYHSKGLSSLRNNNATTVIDDYLWILEPSGDGNIYVYRLNGLNTGLVNTGLTMRKLVEMTPYGDEEPPVMYTGEKKTNLLTVDANNGRVLSWFGSMDSLLAKETCNIGDENSEGTDKCPKTATVTIGRTEYTVSIFGKDDGHHIATLKLSEWSPNNYDEDLQHQYMQDATTLDNKYIYTGHDGSFVSFDHKKSPGADNSGLLFQQKFPSPVARVFDVAKPWGSDKKSTNLIILDQPRPSLDKAEKSNSMRTSNIFLNHTEDGSWYAIIADSYPSVVGGIQAAPCNQEDWPEQHPPWNIFNKTQLSEALVGLHSVENHKIQSGDEIYTISGPIQEEIADNLTLLDSHSSLSENITSLNQFHQLSRRYIQSSIEFLKNPILVLVTIAVVIFNQRFTQLRFSKRLNTTRKYITSIVESTNTRSVTEAVISPRTTTSHTDLLCQVNKPVDDSNKAQGSAMEKLENPEKNLEMAKSELLSNEKAKDVNSSFGTESLKKEKKTHRGRRGGAKHKKAAWKSNRDRSLTPNPETEAPLSLAIPKSKKTHQSSLQEKHESNNQSILNTSKELLGSLVHIGVLEVDTNKLIGTGSNGTMVFQGKFDGREVAVKRMLIQFFDIAFQETKLLRESDDHPNVIRYFAQQQAAGFLYIALELCPASLADIIEKPQNHRELAKAGERDLPNILYQVTNGLRHLHKLRIVHRDLKPQNILVSVGKNNKPRLVVSDFGLCKKLEGEQSSFRATTAHAAGTSGWRAPELLLDDDAREEHPASFDTSTEGNSGSVVLSPELLPTRRATRAIDIFSLGLIFFYVLTKGSHPYDCGDRFMREVNIRKGKYDLDPLEILGDYKYEAKRLIGSMLAAEPKHRPQAHQVMAHPFFWSAKKKLNFLCDVSDHFEKEKRDPPTQALQELERYAYDICGNDFLKLLGKDFVESLGKQRKYTGTKLLDLLRALRNKKNHYEDMNEKLKKDVGPLPDGYLGYWTRRFPRLLVVCWTIVHDLQWDKSDRFRDYYEAGAA